ncbi:MAG TPA: NmrA family NAD(P)-binding protein [Puia sp.]
MLMKESIILVTGATGSQGGAVARALLKNNNRVRVTVRAASLNSAAAEELRKAGAEVVVADMEDSVSLEEALRGVYGLFSVQGMDDGSDSEKRHVSILVAAAMKMGVRHVVHSSVNRAGEQGSFPGWDDGRWNRKYWIDKEHGEGVVRNAGFPVWTIIRPVFFMDNLIPPKVPFIFPLLDSTNLITVFKPTTKLQMVAVEDIGTFAMAAFDDPERFGGQTMDLAGDELKMSEVAECLNWFRGSRIRAGSINEEEAVKKGMDPALANFQEWGNQVGYDVDISAVKSYGLPVTSFGQWLEKNGDLFPYGEDRTPDVGMAVVRRNTKEVQSEGDFSVFEELFAPDFIDHTPQPGGFKADRESVRTLYQMLRTAFPDFYAVIHWQTTDGDKVTTFKTYYGTHLGMLFGIAATGRKIHFESVDVMRVRDGMITDHWGVGNLLSLVQQLGKVIPG